MLEQESLQQSVHRYAAVIRRQWWVALLVSVLAIGAAVGYVKKATPVYSASMKLVVGQGQALFAPGLSVNVQPYTQTITDLVQSHLVAQQTISRLGLKTTPSGLLSHLTVTTDPQTSVINLSYTDTSRQRAVAVLANLGEAFTSTVNNALAPRSTSRSTAGQIASQPVSVVIFDPAHGDPGRVSPKTKQTVVIAAVLGVIAGLLLAFLRDALSGRIRNEDEAEDAYGAPVIGTLPRGALGLPATGLAGLPRKRAARIGDTFQILTTRLRYSTELERGVILVTGARPEDGKSTVSAHIAAVLAASGNEVIAVEADLHRPSLHRLLGVPAGQEGLRDVVALRRDPASVLVPVTLDRAPSMPTRERDATAVGAALSGNGLSVTPREHGEAAVPRAEGGLRLLCAGLAGDSPLSVLSLANSLPLLSRLRGICDYIVVDTPPLLLSGDAYPLLRAADAVVVICRERATSRDEARRTRAILASLGVSRFSLVISESGEAARGDYYGYAGDS